MGKQFGAETPKRRVKAKFQDNQAEAVTPNEVWAMEFAQDQLATGRHIQVVAGVDTFFSYVPVLNARFNYRDEGVVVTLDRVHRRIGYPDSIRLD